jgi:hypothetical protein
VSRDEDLRAMSKNDLVREVVRLRAMLAEQMTAAPGIGEEVEVQGVVGMRDGKPHVHMRAGEAAWMLTPPEALEHALKTLAAAIEAERDAATIAFLQRPEGLAFDEQTAGGFLMAMRDHRDAWTFLVRPHAGEKDMDRRGA